MNPKHEAEAFRLSGFPAFRLKDAIISNGFVHFPGPIAEVVHTGSALFHGMIPVVRLSPVYTRVKLIPARYPVISGFHVLSIFH